MKSRNVETSKYRNRCGAEDNESGSSALGLGGRGPIALSNSLFAIRNLSFKRGLVLLSLGALLLAAPGCRFAGRGPASNYGKKPIRAIWVTRWDYKTPADIARVMEDSRHAGFNTVLFQVRGAGNAMYRSRIEPWAEEIGGKDPGFDPLAVACKEAHRRGLTLHAWVNVIPGWFGKKPPVNRGHIYYTHADWFWRDARGQRQPLGWYSSVNPCYPEVRKYIVSVIHEIVGKYDVDGLHMDYARYPNEWNESHGSGQVPDYPRDQRTVSMFHRTTGKSPDQARPLWDRWRAEQLTQLVRDIRKMMLKTDRKSVLSVAVKASPDEGMKSHFQDTRRWISEGLVDAVYPMNYATDMQTYVNRLQNWKQIGGRVPVVSGIMFDKRDSSLVINQINQTLRHYPHFAAFAYNSMFERREGGGRPAANEQSGSRASLRTTVVPHVQRLSRSRV